MKHISESSERCQRFQLMNKICANSASNCAKLSAEMQIIAHVITSRGLCSLSVVPLRRPTIKTFLCHSISKYWIHELMRFKPSIRRHCWPRVRSDRKQIVLILALISILLMRRLINDCQQGFGLNMDLLFAANTRKVTQKTRLNMNSVRTHTNSVALIQSRVNSMWAQSL